jgi:hypothetical protein
VAETKQIVGVGDVRHSRVVINILKLADDFEVVGLVDTDRELWGIHVDGVRVLGDDDLLTDMRYRGVNHAFNGIGSVGNSEARKRIFEFATEMSFEFPRAIHPSAVIASSSSSNIGAGATVMANATVNPGATIGSNVIVNTGAIVEHDCMVGDQAHIAVGLARGDQERVIDEIRRVNAGIFKLADGASRPGGI